MGERSRVPERGAIGSLLRTFRIAAGLTQEALAELAGVGSRSIQGLECGERRPQRETVHRLIAALELTDSDRARFEAAAQIAPREHRALGLVGGRSDRPSRPQMTVGRSRNVPLPRTSFVGREPELDRLRQLLGSARLLTLTGPPGIGKTRLALEAVNGHLDDFVDGAWFIPVAPMREPALVLAAIAQEI